MSKFASTEELMFNDWLIELQQRNIIKHIIYQHNIKIFSHTKISDIHSLNKLSYTPDFVIIWDNCVPKSLSSPNGIIYNKPMRCDISNNLVSYDSSYLDNINNIKLNTYTTELVSFVDTKGSYSSLKHVSDSTFPVLRKLLYNNHKLYINHIKPLCPRTGLFKNSFVPLTYLFTKTGKQRKLPYKVNTVDEYLRQTPLNNESTTLTLF